MYKIESIEIDMMNKMMDNLRHKELIGDVPNVIIEEVSNQVASLVALHLSEVVVDFRIKSVRENDVLICYAVDDNENTIVDMLFTFKKEENDKIVISYINCSVKKYLFEIAYNNREVI